MTRLAQAVRFRHWSFPLRGESEKMVYLEEMIERLETARDINTETEEADECIDDVISDLRELNSEIRSLKTGLQDAANEQEEELKATTDTDNAYHIGGYIDALTYVISCLNKIVQDEE